MAKRTNIQQSKHDNAVRKLANYYEEQGYRVRADIKGLDRPKSINKRIPDIVAKNRKETVIVEVETKDTVDKDADQRNTFKDYAVNHNKARFWMKTV